MQFKTLAIAAAVGQASATLDVLTNSQISERLFGMTPEQVKTVDRAVHEATVPIVQMAGQVFTNMRPTFEEVMKTSYKVADEAVNAIHRVFTPDVRAKVRTGVLNAVKTTMDNYL